MAATRYVFRIRSLAMLGAASTFTLTGCLGIPSAYRESSPLALEKSLIGPIKYTHNGSEPAKAFGFISYSSSFKELLSGQPAALAEAEKAVPFHYVQFGTLVGALVYSIVDVVNTASDQRNATTFGEFNEAGQVTGTDIAIVFGLAAVSVGSAYAARSHLLKAVGLFNDGARTSGPQASGWGPRLLATLPNSIVVDPWRRTYGIGWKLAAAGW